jgi:nitroreductase
MSLIDTLQWRYATKKMDPTKSVPPEKVDKILEAIRLTASSSGLQPYEILVITNKDIREKIKPIANNQSQITDCSHLLVFAAWDNYTADRINAAFDLTNEIRNIVLTKICSLILVWLDCLLQCFNRFYKILDSLIF